MPIPKPRPNETQEHFISRCMSDETMKDDYPSTVQRYAVCLTSFRDKVKTEEAPRP